MKKLTIIILATLVGASAFAQVVSKNFIDQPYIEVSGKAELELTPDLIYLKVIISEKDNKGKVPLEHLEQKMMKALEALGINTQKEVSIIDFASNFQNYTLKRSDIRTSKEYQVIVHDGNTAAKVYFELEKLDISNISVAKLDHSKIDYHRQQVKIEAMKAAKSKASALCEAIGEKAGKAIYIREINRAYYAGRMNIAASNAVMKIEGNSTRAKDLNVDFQKLKLEYEIEAKFRID